MMYLIWVLNKLNKEGIKTFKELFCDIDLDQEAKDQDYETEEYVNALLETHFGLYFEDERQLKMLTDAMRNQESLKTAIRAIDYFRPKKSY